MTKHIEVHYHYIGEKVIEGYIEGCQQRQMNKLIYSYKESQQSKVGEILRGSRNDLQDNFGNKFALRGSTKGWQCKLLEISKDCKNKDIF